MLQLILVVGVVWYVTRKLQKTKFRFQSRENEQNRGNFQPNYNPKNSNWRSNPTSYNWNSSNNYSSHSTSNHGGTRVWTMVKIKHGTHMMKQWQSPLQFIAVSVTPLFMPLFNVTNGLQHNMGPNLRYQWQNNFKKLVVPRQLQPSLNFSPLLFSLLLHHRIGGLLWSVLVLFRAVLY